MWNTCLVFIHEAADCGGKIGDDAVNYLNCVGCDPGVGQDYCLLLILFFCQELVKEFDGVRRELKYLMGLLPSLVKAW